MRLNLLAYESAKLVPESITRSWKRRALRVLIGEIVALAEKPPRLQLALAEIAFYYFGNPYQALSYIEAVKVADNSAFSVQYAANLRYVIQLGMWNHKDCSKSILSLLTYQEKYNQFLGYIEESCDFTAKFWSALLEPVPDVKTLIKYGKELYEKRYQLQRVANEIIRISTSHTEFLVKYGLYTKLILHDSVSASAVFKKILWATDQSCGSGADRSIMMVVVSLEKPNFFAVVEVNHEVEYQLGYKREELLRFSAMRLMPAVVARQHQGLVQRFFQTMQSAGTVGVERFTFVLHQSGCVLPCRATTKIVPSLSNGLQGMMLFYADPRFSAYTSQRTEKYRAKVSSSCYNGE